MSWAVLFDIDGTLVDSVDLHARAWHEAFARFGFDVALDRVRGQIGKGGDQLMPVFLPEDDLRKRGPEIERYCGDLYRSRYLHLVRPFPHVRGLFLRLRRDGARIGLATSANPDTVGVYTRLANIDDLVDADADGDDVERSKPFPDVVLATLRKLGDLPPGSATMIGDSPYDMQAATASGARALGVRCGGFPSHQLLAAGASDLFDSPGDLLAHYEEAFPEPVRR